MKTNAMRILEAAGIAYGTASYPVDEDHLDAVHAAQELGVSPDRVFKTIVMQGSSKQIYVFCTPAAYEVNLKKARAITGEKEIGTLPLKDLQKTTGYVRGGCSPLGMIKKYPLFLEESAFLSDTVYISAGQRGLQIVVSPEDLMRAGEASVESFV